MIFVVNMLLQIYFKLIFDYLIVVDRGNVVLNIDEVVVFGMQY